MTLDFAGQTAVVTGATRGIGRAIADLLLGAGCRVIGTGSAPGSDLGGESHVDRYRFEGVDFLDAAATDSFVRSLAGEPVDILVNNAGINRISLVGDMAPSDWDDIQAVNVRTPMLLTRALAPSMAERGYGRIVNISSIFGVVTRSQRAAYTTSKYALNGFTKTTAIDYGGRNVLCNAVAPGFIDTELTRRILSAEQRDELAAATPAGRMGTPDEIARVVAFLASDANTFINGQVIIADGGFTSI